MRGEFSPPVIVVVHRGEVVVDEGVGVDEFECAGDGHDRFGFPSDRLRGGHTEDRPKPFSPAIRL